MVPEAGSKKMERWKIAFSTITQWQGSLSAQEGALWEYIEYFWWSEPRDKPPPPAVAADSLKKTTMTAIKTLATNRGFSGQNIFLNVIPSTIYSTPESSRCWESFCLSINQWCKRWFKDYERVIHEHGICHQDIYTIFTKPVQIGVEEPLIITRHPKRSYSRLCHKSRICDCLEAVSADGFTCPPLIILSAKQALALVWYHPGRWTTLSLTPAISLTLAYQWIQLFHTWTIGRTLRKKVPCDRFWITYDASISNSCEKKLSHTSHIPASRCRSFQRV